MSNCRQNEQVYVKCFVVPHCTSSTPRCPVSLSRWCQNTTPPSRTTGSAARDAFRDSWRSVSRPGRLNPPPPLTLTAHMLTLQASKTSASLSSRTAFLFCSVSKFFKWKTKCFQSQSCVRLDNHLLTCSGHLTRHTACCFIQGDEVMKAENNGNLCVGCVVCLARRHTGWLPLCHTTDCHPQCNQSYMT